MKKGTQLLLDSLFLLVDIADELSNTKFIEDFDKIVSFIKSKNVQG